MCLRQVPTIPPSLAPCRKLGNGTSRPDCKALAAAAVEAAGAAGAAGTASRQQPWLLLGLAGAAAAGAAAGGTLLLRRERQGRSVHSGRASKYRQLGPDADGLQSAPSQTSEASAAWRGGSHQVLGAVRRRRQRLAHLLRSGTGALQMMPLPGLPPDVAHRLAPPSRMPVGGPSIELAPLVRGGPTHTPLDSWGWGMDTLSLAMPAESLQVRWGDWQSPLVFRSCTRGLAVAWLSACGNGHKAEAHVCPRHPPPSAPHLLPPPRLSCLTRY